MADSSRTASMASLLGRAPNNWYQSYFDPVREAYGESISNYLGYWQEAPSLSPISTKERRFQTLEGMALTLENKLDKLLDEVVRGINFPQISPAMEPPHPPPPDPYGCHQPSPSMWNQPQISQPVPQYQQSYISPPPQYIAPEPYDYSLPISVPYDYYYYPQQQYSTLPPSMLHHYPSSSGQWLLTTSQITPQSQTTPPSCLQQQQRHQEALHFSCSDRCMFDEMSVRNEVHIGPKSEAPYVFDEMDLRVERLHKEPEIFGPQGHVRNIVDEGLAQQFETENGSLEVATESTVRENEVSHEESTDSGTDKEKQSNVDDGAKSCISEDQSNNEGRVLSLDLAQKGLFVTMVDYSEEGKKEAASLIEKQNAIFHAKLKVPSAMFIQSDVTNTRYVSSAFERHLEKYGGLDICINDAGIGSNSLFDKDESDGNSTWRRVTNVYLTVIIDRTCIVTQAMKVVKKPGIIINLGPVSNPYPMPGNPIYSDSKGGVVLFTRSLSPLKREGIGVNVLGPEFVKTELAAMVDPFLEFEDEKAYISDYLRGLGEILHLFPNNWVIADMSKLDLEEDRYLKYSCHQKSVLEELMITIWDPGIKVFLL